MLGSSRSKRVGQRQKNVLTAGGDHRHTIIDEENEVNEGCPSCPTLNAVHTLVLLLSLTVVFSWVSFCFMEHSVISHANVVLLRALQARCHALVLSADVTATHASQLIRTHKNFIKGKIKAMASSSSIEINRQNDQEKTIASPSTTSPLIAAEFAAIYNLPALSRNIETELHSQTQIFGSQPLTVVFHKANTAGQMPFGTIPWEDYFLHYPSSPAVTTTTTIDASQKSMTSTTTTITATTTAPSYGIPSTPRDRLLSDAQVVPVALAARTIKGTTHPYAHLFNDIITEGDYYIYNHTDKAPCEIHAISLKQDSACRWDSLQGQSITLQETNTTPYP